MDDTEFKRTLSPEQYHVMREKGTEKPHSGKYWNLDEGGIYSCAACANILFLSLHKAESESGWPTFKKPASTRSVALNDEGERTEITCKKCRSHIGYMVDDKKYEVNSTALYFQEFPEIDWDLEQDDSEEKTPDNSNAKTITFTIGGIAIGGLLGAGALWAATPTTMCVATSTPAVILPATTTPIVPASTTNTPAPTGGGRPPASPATTSSSLPAAGASTATATPATSSSATP